MQQVLDLILTAVAWDGGADMLIESTNGKIVAIIQCKHVSSHDKTTVLNIDLDRAAINYGCIGKLNDVWKIGITNATKISKADQQWYVQLPLHLILSDANSLIPESIYKIIEN